MSSSLCRPQQRGAALLIMMLVVLVSATAILVTRVNSNSVRNQQLRDTQAVLADARDALIDYATVYPDLTPGDPSKLPCPDIDDGGGLLEGEAHSATCGAAGETVMGRLPWRTLGISPGKDSAAACLWYVVSGTYKDAGGSTAELINSDSNGQLQLYGIEAAAVIAGIQPGERPLAMIIAPMPAIGGQTRAAPSGAGRQCSTSFDATQFLDVDGSSGISNASLSGVADAVELLATSAGRDASHNDRIALVTRIDLARRVSERHDYDTNMRALGRAAALCVADYASNNPGGVNDRRMPYPAPLSMADYRPNGSYDDTDVGILSGRLPDIVDDSNLATGNAIGQILSNCDSAAVVEWTPQMRSLWQNWKDHFFYAVAESFTPTASVPSSCGTCLSVNGSGQYAAVLIFSDAGLPSLGQVRNAPPTDVDTKSTVGNYLEDANASNVPYTAGAVDFVSQAATTTFNDLLFCVDDTLGVSEC